ncbi:MAG: RNA polymerase sigma factor [Elusimicrobiota bacterium]
MNPKKAKPKEFGEVINRFSLFIRGHIYRYNLQKDGIDPDDIAQEVCIKIWKILEDEKKIKNYASYIRKIVDSSVIDQLRKLKREEGILNHEKQKIISERKSRYKTDILLDENLKKTISQSVESLLESRRKVVKLFLLNMTIDEIATIFHWSKDKTRNLLYRGLNDLKNMLKEKNIHYENKQ